MADEKVRFGPTMLQGTVPANGTVTVQFQAAGYNYVIDVVSVKCTTHTLEAVATIYQNQIGDMYRIDATFTGSSGDTCDTAIHVNDGESVWIQWVGADVGSVCTATISGWKYVPQRGFRTRDL